MRIGGAGKRRDASEPAIIQALEAAGALVMRLTGAGVPDLLCLYKGEWQPFEVKSGKRGRTALQEQYADVIPVVRNVEDALLYLGVYPAQQTGRIR